MGSNITQNRKYYKTSKNPAKQVRFKTTAVGMYSCDSQEEVVYPPSNRYEFLLITNGKGFFRFNKDMETVEEGDCVFIHSNKEHSEMVDGQSQLRGIFFEFQKNDELDELLLDVLKENVIHTNDSYRAFLSLFNLLLIEARSKDVRYSNQIINGISTTILYKILHISPIFDIPEKTNDTYMEFKKYIDAHFTEDIVLSEVCDLLSTNKYYISRLFREFMGTTPAHYIIEKRIQYAKILLENPSMTIENIASMVGYQDYYHFSRLFKKEVGISPKDYRKKILNDIKETTVSTNVNLGKQKVGDIADFGGWNEQMVVKETADKDGITWIGSQDESKYNQAWFYATKVTKDNKGEQLRNYTYSCYIKPLSIDNSVEGKVQLYIGTITHKYCIAIYTKNGFIQIWDNSTGGWVSEAAKADFVVDEANLVEIKHGK